MKCPECVEEGIKSRVMPGSGSVTLAYYQPFYDEDGIYHNHDGNTTFIPYTCSNGHSWEESSRGSCPNCGWTCKSVLPPRSDPREGENDDVDE